MARMPREGFLKVVRPEPASVDPVRKAALIRKGNELFNGGEIETARRIFLTLGYTDGIIRLGDYYYKKADYFEAYKLYSQAPAPEKVNYLIKRMAGVIREWIKDE
ncbi:MAG: hypothetical protein CSA76_00305 [Spirochaetales bacterium]|nr:MAG: hypothetical protein CSA76_00305 [Spirochaetales bacterium]